MEGKLKTLRNQQAKPKTEAGTFASKGVGTNKTLVIAVGYSQEVYDILRSLPKEFPNRSEYIRKAVIRQMEKDGLLPPAEGFIR